jgi:hypothetical protein
LRSASARRGSVGGPAAMGDMIAYRSVA